MDYLIVMMKLLRQLLQKQVSKQILRYQTSPDIQHPAFQ